jgi:hypothetical protein
MLSHAGRRLGGDLLFVVDRDRLQVLGFKYLAAIEALHVVHSVSARKVLGAVVIAGSRHRRPG